MRKFGEKSGIVYSAIIAYFILCCIVSCIMPGTTDSGDSIMHFLFSKYAFSYPEFFFHHWAKPVFVLLSAPFSQFGIIGIKIFNSLVASLTLLFTFQAAKKLKMNHAWLVIVMFCFAPLNFTLTFSGLTEPLFALFLAAALYYSISNKYIVAAIILSFMPLVRSEGLIIAGVFAFYFIYKRSYKVLPFLLLGHVVYSIAGYFTHHDLLWVFTKIPYAKLSSTYGSGELMHFVNQMTYVTGVPIYGFLWLGIIAIIVSFFYKQLRSIFKDYSFEIILIYGCFFAFFVAHSLFWYFGIFNSMGLKRVMVGIMPCVALIGVNGFLFVNKLLPPVNLKVKTGIQVILITYILVFPFTKNPAAINFKGEFSLNDEQILCAEVAENIKQLNSSNALYYHIPYLSVALNIDHFNPAKHRELSAINDNTIAQGSLIIWDNWWAVVEDGIGKEQFSANSNYELLKSFTKGEREILLFMRKTRNDSTKLCSDLSLFHACPSLHCVQ